MRPDVSDESYLWDMLDAALAIQEFIAGKNFRDYTSDRLLRGAVERHIEIMGEAAKNLSKEFREKHTEVQWSKIISQRNVLAHEYGEIKHERIWAVATIHVIELIGKLKPLIPQIPE